MAKKTSKSGAPATVKVRQVKSAIGTTQQQRQILKGIGLRRINHTVEREDSPGLRGMLVKVGHLVEVVES